MKTSVIKSLLMVVAVFFFYTNIPVYLYVLEYSSITPLFWIELFAVAVVFSLMIKLFNEGNLSRITLFKPLLFWTFFYIGISLLWFLFSGRTQIVEGALRSRLLGVIFFFLFLAIIYEDENLQTKVRWVLLLSVLIAVGNNIYDFIVPFTFVPSEFSEISNPGRSAGLYMNANQAGAALLLGMIFTVGLLSNKFRTPYVFLILFGILLTFSRAALIGWFIVVLILLFQKILSKKQFFAVLGTVTLITYLSLPWLSEFVTEKGEEGINMSDILERIDWFRDPAGVENIASQERKKVFERAWEMFAEHPVIGNGIGSTDTWTALPHNMYLYFMSDHGIIGIFILPLFVLAAVWRARGKARQIALPFLIFILFWGFFSHNIMQEYYILISFALMGAMTIRSRFGKEQTV